MKNNCKMYVQREQGKTSRMIGLFVLMILCVSLCACSKVGTNIMGNSNGGHGPKTERVLTTQNGVGLVNFSSASSWGDYSQPMYTYVVSVTTDGVINLEYVCDNYALPKEYQIIASRTLEREEYDAIYSYFNESDLIKYDGEYGDSESCDGGYLYFNFTLDDSTLFRAGGLNPHEQVFEEAQAFLEGYITQDMRDQADEKLIAADDYFENHHYTMQYASDMEKLNVSFTEEQLEAVGEENMIVFFYNCELAASDGRINYMDAERSEDGLVTASTYQIQIRQDDYEYDIYIDGELAATLPMLTRSEIYEDYLEQLGIPFTEEQLVSVETAIFISDLRQLILQNCYARIYASFDAGQMVFTGEGYRFELIDDMWNIIIGEEVCAQIPYESIHEHYQSDLEKYEISLTEEQLQKIPIDDVIFYIESFEEDKEDDLFVYDESTNDYTSKYGSVSFEWKEGDTYCVMCDGEKICEIVTE